MVVDEGIVRSQSDGDERAQGAVSSRHAEEVRNLQLKKVMVVVEVYHDRIARLRHPPAK
jgi:hypothetical protein